jgi:hypothetical protein
MRSQNFLASLLLLILSLITRCGRHNQNKFFQFNTDIIPSFIVDITRDTVIKAPGGSLLKIPAGALYAGDLTHV